MIYIQNRFTNEVILEVDAATLDCADLIDADLRNADLSGADLRNADLSGADLSGADLRNADLSDADLEWTNLKGADLREADLEWTNLKGADLREADLRRVSLDYSVFPLWCGSFGIKCCTRLPAQLAAHFVMLDCDDPEVLEMQKVILPLARQFHRWEEQEMEAKFRAKGLA